MTLSISIDCTNAAFESPNAGPELASLIRSVADRIEPVTDPVNTASGLIRDTNGNRVGSWALGPVTEESNETDPGEWLMADGWSIQSDVLDPGDYKSPSKQRVTVTRNGQEYSTTYMMGAAHRVWSRSVSGDWPAHDSRGFNRPFKEGERVPSGIGSVTLWTEERLLKYTRPSNPELADMVYSLVSDSNCVRYGQSFEDFADELGYDKDSRTAEAAYRACQEEWHALVRLGADLDKLDELFQDY